VMVIPDLTVSGMLKPLVQRMSFPELMAVCLQGKEKVNPSSGGGRQLA